MLLRNFGLRWIGFGVLLGGGSLCLTACEFGELQESTLDGPDGAAPDEFPEPAMPGGEPAREPAELAGITRLHNQARARVSPAADPPLEPLVFSAELVEVAQAWAARCQFEHSSNGFGENLHAEAGQESNGGSVAAGVIDGWVAEEENYDYASNTCGTNEVCGHYTQVVWDDTRELGCALAHCTTGSPFDNFPEWDLVVCNYDPPGNIRGARPY